MSDDNWASHRQIVPIRTEVIVLAEGVMLMQMVFVLIEI
jgi:hypothetical protein